MTDAATSSPVNEHALKAYVERIEKLEEDKRATQEDIKEVCAEAKGNGFDPKIIRKIVALRRKTEQERKEEELLIETYERALKQA